MLMLIIDGLDIDNLNSEKVHTVRSAHNKVHKTDFLLIIMIVTIYSNLLRCR